MNISQIIANPFYYPNSSTPYYTSSVINGQHNDPHSESESTSYFEISRCLIIKFSSRGHNLEESIFWMTDMINVFFLDIFGSKSQLKNVFERLQSEFDNAGNVDAVTECDLWLLILDTIPASEE
jgi:hypothetical protein